MLSCAGCCSAGAEGTESLRRACGVLVSRPLWSPQQTCVCLGSGVHVAKCRSARTLDSAVAFTKSVPGLRRSRLCLLGL